MKHAETTVADFTAKGMAAIETKFAQPRDQLQMVITVPTSVYENLLRNAFNNIPLFTGKKDGYDRPIRYDPTSRLLFSKEDGRLLIPMKLVEEALKKETSGPMSNFGAELNRQARAGNAEAPLFQYDKTGKYVGVEVNGKLMGPEELYKPYDSKTCNLCQKPRSAKCGACKGVGYCSAECQKADWPAHKQNCRAIREALSLMQ